MAKKYYLDDHGLVTYNELIKKKISELVSFDVKVVDSLPLTGEEHILYLVPNAQDPNIHDEYLWVDEKWELIGNTTINLDDYYTKEEIDSSISVINSSIQNISINALNDSLIVNNSSISFNSDTSYIHLSASDDKLLLNSSIITLADASNGSTGLAMATDIYDELTKVEKVTAAAITTMTETLGLDESLNPNWSQESGINEASTYREVIEKLHSQASNVVNTVNGETSITGADTTFVYVASNPTSGSVSLTSGVVLAANNYGSTAATGLTTDAYVQDLLAWEIIE